MWWRIRSDGQPLATFLEFVRDFTSFVIDMGVRSDTNMSLLSDNNVSRYNLHGGKYDGA